MKTKTTAVRIFRWKTSKNHDLNVNRQENLNDRKENVENVIIENEERKVERATSKGNAKVLNERRGKENKNKNQERKLGMIEGQIEKIVQAFAAATANGGFGKDGLKREYKLTNKYKMDLWVDQVKGELWARKLPNYLGEKGEWKNASEEKRRLVRDRRSDDSFR